MRINKYLASCGIASRRNSEKLIQEGRVKINGRVVTELATDVRERDKVEVDGNAVSAIERHVYLMLNKPKGCLCTVSDDRGRKTVMDYLPERNERLFPVGRLDYDTEGLLLLTTDGDFANLLTHPSACVPKTYVAKVEGAIDEAELNVLRRGVILDGKKTKPAKVQFLGYEGELTRIEVIISEGRNRQVRRMFEAIGKNVVFLKRTQIGPLRLGGLARGGVRSLTEREIGYFKIKTSK